MCKANYRGEGGNLEQKLVGCLGIRKMCQSGATCLPAECCFSEPALQKPTQRVGLGESGRNIAGMKLVFAMT